MSSDFSYLVEQTLFPENLRRQHKLVSENKDFVHYTSADAAMSIIQNKEVWMRNALTMNDFSEVEHGLDCVRHAWHSTAFGQKLKQCLNRIKSHLADEVWKEFEQHQSGRRAHTYLLSLSEHGDKLNNERKYGRLSMWRAYGGDTNVALVFDREAVLRNNTGREIDISPVFYGDREKFSQSFGEVVTNIENQTDSLMKLDLEFVRSRMADALHYAMLSTKHPGFKEEAEWRIIYSPTIRGDYGLGQQIRSINGIPQRVFTIKLEDQLSLNQTSNDTPVLLKEIIIGPTLNPYPIQDALEYELKEAGVRKPHEKVRVSNIPLRR